MNSAAANSLDRTQLHENSGATCAPIRPRGPLLDYHGSELLGCGNPCFFTDFRAGWRVQRHYLQYGGLYGFAHLLWRQFGIPNTCPAPYSKSTAMPNITAGGYSIAQAAGGGGGTAAPRNYVDPQWGGAANASWTKGRHTI